MEPTGGVVGGKTDGVVTRLVGGEGKFTLGGPTGAHDAVTGSDLLQYGVGMLIRTNDRLRTYINIHLNAQVRVFHVFLVLLIPFQCSIVA